MTSLWTNENDPHCWVCGHHEENPEQRYDGDERFHMIIVWGDHRDQPKMEQSPAIHVHAGTCWRLLENLTTAVSPWTFLLSGPPVPKSVKIAASA